MCDGLQLIEQRSRSLQRFLGGYARLARLPAPRISPFPLRSLCERVQRLMDDALALDIEDGLWLRAEMDQTEQVLINLVRNALEAGGTAPVRLRARAEGGQCCIQIIDDGAGLPSSDSLFVPFFTTKPGGSGIGLVLSRQIIEAQGGTLVLKPGAGGRGAVAEAILPLHDPAQAPHAAAADRRPVPDA
ncbi:MAG: sensor histidine kinase [Lysobacter sp.]